MVTQNPDTMLFSVVRTEEREPLFHWIGVVCDVRSYLYKLKSRDDITAEKLSDLKKFLSVSYVVERAKNISKKMASTVYRKLSVPISILRNSSKVGWT